jgi:hypothetical protein
MHYRLYTLDSAEGRITAGADMQAADDRHALREASASHGADGHFELWQGTRRVFPDTMAE